VVARRSLIAQLGLLGAGAAFLWLRHETISPEPTIQFPNGSATTGWMSYPVSGGLIRLSGIIRGKAVEVVVDSGAEFSAVDAALAASLGLPPATLLPLPLLAYGISGGLHLTRTVRLDLQLERMRLNGLHAATIDLSGISDPTGYGFSMLLGRNVLSALVMDVDFPGRRIAFMKPDVYRAPKDVVDVAVTRRAGALMAPVTLEGSGPVDALIDTGMTGAIGLAADVARAAGLLGTERSVRTAPSIGLGGVSLDRVVVAREVGFAGLTLTHVPVQVFSPPRASPMPSALIGVGLLRHFRVAMDLGGGRMQLMSSRIHSH
jgi:predicted aspartyl protease